MSAQIVGVKEMLGRIETVVRAVAKKEGWEKAELRLQRHLRNSPQWEQALRKKLGMEEEDESESS